MELGWCCYSDELHSPAHLEAVRRLRPRAVRWMLEVDRHVLGTNPVNWTQRYGAAFATLAETGTPLIVQLAMKKPDWTAGDLGNVTGAAWWRAGPRAGWPRDPSVTWLPFVDGLHDELARCGVDVAAWGAWNEPDWRSAWPWQGRAAPITEWLSGQFLWWPAPPLPPFGWSGGHERLAGLRAARPWTWGSDGVSTASADWLDRTAADPTVSVIDVHCYAAAVDVAMTYTASVVDRFDESRVDRLPIVVGEYGDDAARGTGYSTEWRDRALRYVTLIEDAYPGRLIGVCAHIQGPQAQALWQVL